MAEVLANHTKEVMMHERNFDISLALGPTGGKIKHRHEEEKPKMANEKAMHNSEEFSSMTKRLAKHCDDCKLCTHARENPDTMFGKVVHWHGTWCPAWKARQKVYGDK